MVDRTRSDVRNELPDSDPTVFGSFIRAITDSLASRAYDLVLLIQQALDQFFPQTSTGTFLERWAGYEDLTRLSSSSASGTVVFTGTADTTIPINTQIRSSVGNIYVTQNAVSIANNVFSISSLTRSGSTATASATGHPLASGVDVTIAGAVQTEYNGTFTVTVIDENTFSYEITGSPTTPATGTITGTVDSASAIVESQETGQALNLPNGASFTLVNAISGVDAQSFANASGIVGGTDLETDDQLRIRVLQSRANPVANFNTTAIEKQARLIAGVTRVFVRTITTNVGDVTIYFFRDNDLNPIPTSSQLNDVKNSILQILQASSDPSNVIVSAPTIVNTDFTFTAISPDTPTMRTAIENNLKAFFEDRVTFETNVDEDKYKAAIIETQDTQTGEFLESFTLSAPSGDISISSGEIAGLGQVIFS